MHRIHSGMFVLCLFTISFAVLISANPYHYPQHQTYHCVPKITVKHHTVPVYVPYTVYEKYPVYKYEHYPVKVPVYVKVKEEYKHEPHYYKEEPHYHKEEPHYHKQENHENHYEHNSYDDHGKKAAAKA